MHIEDEHDGCLNIARPGPTSLIAVRAFLEVRDDYACQIRNRTCNCNLSVLRAVCASKAVNEGTLYRHIAYSL